MFMKFLGKVAVVTNASKGIGAAKYLLAEGSAVVVNCSASKEAAEGVVQRITESGGTAVTVESQPRQPCRIGSVEL